MWFTRRSATLVAPQDALAGRDQPILIPGRHTVLGTPIGPPFPETTETIQVAMGCFWGAERVFWRLDGVYTTAVGYAGGFTPNPTYEEVCSGQTGHTEAVLVVFEPARISLAAVLRAFFEGHDPTQGMRQGNDLGSQYRSAIYTTSPQQHTAVIAVRDAYAAALAERGLGDVTTEIAPAGAFYYAEEYHQQYLDKHPNGYCGLGGTGVSCPIGVGVTAG
jgi:peptide-methionine (S)-S-oxide reductase